MQNGEYVTHPESTFSQAMLHWRQNSQKPETLRQNTIIKNNVDNQNKIEAFILIAFVATIFSLQPQFV